jgi:hypothetical protein
LSESSGKVIPRKNLGFGMENNLIWLILQGQCKKEQDETKNWRFFQK